MQQPSISKIKSEPMDEKSPTNDTVIALVRDTDEIIAVNDSQPTQEIYRHIFDSKRNAQLSFVRNSPVKTKNIIRIECEVCDEVIYSFCQR